jgi:HK97 family phage major capsid protein
MTTLRQLLEQRTSLTERMRAIHAPHEGKALPEAEQRQFDALRAELEPLTQAIDRQALIDELDRRAGGTPLDGGGDASFDKLASQVTVLDVIRAQMGGTDAAAGRAREVSAELERRSGRKAEGLYFHMGQAREQRVFTTTLPAGGPGGALIQTDVSPNLIDRLREKIVVRALGATVLTGLMGNLSIPRLKASASGTWVAENNAIPPSDPQTDGVGFTPKHVGGIVEISRNMIQQPSLDVARMVEDDLSKIIAVAIDAAALVGGGANQPSGLLSASSGITIVPIAAVGGPPTWDAVIALIAAVDTSNALVGGSLAFATNAKAVSKMRRTIKTSADTASNFIQTDPNALAGYPLASTQLVPSNGTKSTGTNLSALIFGDWSGLVLGFWSELDILVNPFESTAYSKGNVQVRAMATADVGIKHPLAFAAITDMVTV